MGYFSEFRTEWRPTLAAMLGLGTGFAATQNMTNLMGPHMLKEFGWSQSEFASVNVLSLLMVIAIPLSGRLADLFGVRRTAAIGAVVLPLTYIACSMMTGPFWQYIVIFLVQALICVTTTATVFSRIVVERFTLARGLALAVVASAPAIVGTVGIPFLSAFVAEHGWRAGYQVAAVFCAICLALALIMLPSSRRADAPVRVRRRARDDYPAIVKNGAFWVMVIALLLCNLPQIVLLSQVGILAEANGIGANSTWMMISAVNIGTLVGRFGTGLAIDRFPSHIVAAVAMSLPSIGLFLIASDFDTLGVLVFAFFAVGLLFGSEGDLVGYLVARSFGITIYGSVMGLMTAAISISAVTGSAILGLMLGNSTSFVPFLLLGGVSVLIGGLTFLLLGRVHRAESQAISAAQATAL